MRPRKHSAHTAHTLLIALLSTALFQCRTNARRTVTEQIAGRPQVRSFASGTAYEAFFRAELAMLRGDATQAARQMELATFADESDGWLAARRSEFLLLSGDREQALESAQEATRRFPRQAATWLVLGEVLTAGGAHAEATAAFTRALEEAPDDPETRATVALAQGASRSTAETARENAPDARPGDRTIAQRSLLDAGRDSRPTLATVRRERARLAAQRGAWSEVDALLTPLVVSARATQQDRVQLIEARAQDGRGSTVASLVTAVSADPQLDRTELARLWLLVERPALALELVTQIAAPSGLTRWVHGTALARTGQSAEALSQWNLIPPTDSHFVEAQIAAAQVLALSAHRSWAIQLLSRAIARLNESSHTEARDRLRIARVQLSHIEPARTEPSQLAETTAALQGMESAWGRQQRAILLVEWFFAEPSLDLASLEAPLRERSNSKPDDARATANLAVACALGRLRCDASEPPALLQRALSLAAQDLATLRAAAVLQTDPQARVEALHRLGVRAPLDRFTRWLSEHFSTQNR